MTLRDVFGLVGTTLGGSFRVEEVIAEGGYGVVYRAEHVAFRAPTAIKCLKIPESLRGQSDAFVERFREEAEILFHLSAKIPEVVRPLHADTITLEDGASVPYIAMEWVDGLPLDSIVLVREQEGQEPLALEEVVKMLTPIAHALARAHRFETPDGHVVSVTHSDLKPENILITAPGSAVKAKILDFGIARARGAAALAAGRITGSEKPSPFTPAYGAPEQWLPKRYGQTGPWTDVWGLALTLVECVAGHPPIDGDNQAMMAMALDKERRPTPRTEGAKISDAAEAVFQRALAIDPRSRYSDIESFWSALEKSVGAQRSFGKVSAVKVSAPPRAVSEAPSDPSPGKGFELDLSVESQRKALRDVPAEDAPMAKEPRVETKRAHVAPAPPPRASELEAARSLLTRLRMPILLLATALIVTTVDVALAYKYGGTLLLGPVRARWIAALLMVAGIGLGASKVLGGRDGR